MYLARKSLFSVTLVGALFGTPAHPPVQAPATPGGAGHPPLMQLATLPARVRVRRRIRGAKARVIALWDRLRLRDTAGTIRARGELVQPRLLPHESYARGPPRALDGNVEAGTGKKPLASSCGRGLRGRRRVRSVPGDREVAFVFET